MLEVSRIILFVKEMKVMLTFYEEVLGLQRIESSNGNDDFISLSAGAIQLSLHKIPQHYARNIKIGDPPVARKETPVKVAFKVDNVSEMRELLESRGGRMRKIQVAEDVRFCDGIDPEGNIFQISDRP